MMSPLFFDPSHISSLKSLGNNFSKFFDLFRWQNGNDLLVIVGFKPSSAGKRKPLIILYLAGG